MTRDRTPAFTLARAAAGVLFLDDTGRVLLVEPSYKDYLDLPGGYVEAGETPWAAATREVREELGIEPPVGRLLVADWWHDNIDGLPGAKILLVFDGGQLTQSQLDQIRHDNQEVTGHAFHHVDELTSVTIPRLATRIQHAAIAHHDDTTHYLEAGHPIGDAPPRPQT